MSTISEIVIRYRPPRIAMLLLILASGIHWVILPLRVEIFTSPVLAACAAVMGFAVMMWAWWLFQKAETAICPTERSSVLVTTGIYRLTRNPMYLGMLMMIAGMALWVGTLPYYLVTVMYFLIINQVFCAFEEARLTAVFGEEYSVYVRKVRRWI